MRVIDYIIDGILGTDMSEVYRKMQEDSPRSADEVGLKGTSGQFADFVSSMYEGRD